MTTYHVDSHMMWFAQKWTTFILNASTANYLEFFQITSYIIIGK